MSRARVSSKFAARVWQERARWICDGIDALGRACDEIWVAPAGRSPLGAGVPLERAAARFENHGRR